MRQLELRLGFHEAEPEPYQPMNLKASVIAPPVDGRQSETALKIARGTARLLHAHGYCVVSELPLARSQI